MKFPLPYSCCPAESLSVSGGTKKPTTVGTLGMWWESAINPEDLLPSPPAHSSFSQQSQQIPHAGRCPSGAARPGVTDTAALGEGCEEGEQIGPKGLVSGSSESVTSMATPAGLKRGFAASLSESQRTGFLFFCVLYSLTQGFKAERIQAAAYEPSS